MRKRIIAILVGIGIAFVVYLFVEQRIMSVYQSLVSNHEIVTAFIGHNEEAIAQVTTRYGLVYQEIQDGSIIFTSDPALPQPNIIRMKIKKSPDVLTGDISQLLRTLAPVRFFKDRRLFVGAPFFIELTDESGYLVYIQALP